MRNPISRIRTLVVVVAPLLLWSSVAAAASRYVATSGNDGGNDCMKEAAPCKTIAHGIGAMAGGDTLIIGDGTYAESITDMPSGSAAAYTTIRAKNDWGVTIDGSNFPNTFKTGINIQAKHYVTIRGFHVKMNQANGNNGPIGIPYSDHVKIQRCSGSYAAIDGNAGSFGVGPAASYVLIEECYGFGGGRYQFLVYQSDHVIVRRSVARNDHWMGSLQCAGFVNYNSMATAWQNNVAIDSDTANCTGRLYGGFFNENKTDNTQPTSQKLQGNIILNVQAFYAGDTDDRISSTRVIEDSVIWGSSGGYWGDQGNGVAANISATRLTIGGITGTYDGPNGGPAHGTGFVVTSGVQNSLTNSVLAHCNSFGVADYTASDYNAFFANGAPYGGQHMPTQGTHDRNDDSVSKSLLYLPRIEPNSPLKTAGQGGGQIGAEIIFKIGATGSLQDDPGWDVATAEPLWPYPNEDQIRNDMAAYSGPGAAGARGFTTGKSLDGTQQTLTKYIWEYLGNKIPPDVYGFHIAVGSLPYGVVGTPYSAPVTVGGGAAPYTWALVGSLPAGLALDPATGVIAGTPTTPGSTDFSITATDSAKATTTKPLTLVIKLVADPPDGGVSDDGGLNAATAGGDSGGCGCRAGARLGGSALAVSAAIFGLMLVRRRARSRSR